MFGLFQNKEQVVREAIQKLIEREKTIEIRLFQGIEEEIRRGKSINPRLYYVTNYIMEKHASGSVDYISSKTMYKALQSLSPLADYDVDNDHAFVTVGHYHISINGGYKDGSRTYILIGIKGTHKYIEEKLTKLIESTPVSKSEDTNFNMDVGSRGMTPAMIEALSDIDEDEIPF